MKNNSLLLCCKAKVIHYHFDKYSAGTRDIFVTHPGQAFKKTDTNC